MVEKYKPIGRKFWKKYRIESKLELEADDNLSFDDIAVCAITMEADLMFEPKCREALKKFQEKSSLAKEKSIEALMELVDWRGVYNQQVLDILDEMAIDSYEDKGGAYGWIDPEGNYHFGDNVGAYPWYADEETLKKHLEEQFQEIPLSEQPESEPFMSEEKRFSEEEE